MAPANPIDYFAIQNIISRYCVALDTKDFDLLKQVFTEDVDANYPFNKAMKGLQEVTNAIHERLVPYTTQHALTTQTISIATDGKSAEATTYFTGTHWEKGSSEGRIFTAMGRYMDTLALIEGPESLPGSSGQWRITRREVVFMGTFGT